jgi:hypothetical protein
MYTITQGGRKVSQSCHPIFKPLPQTNKPLTIPIVQKFAQSGHPVFKPLPQTNKPLTIPIGQKFAQSGHPARLLQKRERNLKFYLALKNDALCAN